MRTLEKSLTSLAEDDRPLVDVLAPDGSVARSYSYRRIVGAAAALATDLRAHPVREREARPAGDPTDPAQLQVGVVTANGPEFLVADFAILGAGGAEVVVPLAFTAEQAASLLADIDVCLADAAGAARLEEWGLARVLPPDARLRVLDIDREPDGTDPLFPDAPSPDAGERLCKIIHTSGTTSRPKGVCIREAALDELIGSLRTAMPDGAYRRYLSLVPMSLLIEQVTAVYLVVCDGGTVVLLPPEVPLVGTSSFAPRAVLPHLRAARPTALVVTPALAEAMLTAADAAHADGRDPVAALFGRGEAPLVCCGGAPVDADTLRRLDAHGIPVHEGYGLSENSSVVSWNTPGARRYGSVGRPLAHVRVRTAPDGELLVKSTSLFAGYKGGDDPSGCEVDEDGWLHTGDLADIEDDGYIWIKGRKKSVIITAAGRNVAPEWVEAQYRSHPAVLAVAVVGDGLPALHGLFLVDPRASLDTVRAELDALGRERLSDVERVEVAHLVPADESLHAEFFTVTGRPRRSAVLSAVTAGRFG
ncbi:AMP-binding protein [Streptomyces sp. JB150]|uniref:AMP-binding protein n=1 Tax=Streptomyces sp. JB150 TaxID=2714844 RepID=UPI0014084D3B|nr:AMP-binding protein [Streptomyces sp. JB150]QIJ65847.1 long-chain fatty acid--CoA ligase [Streptomyces sp. JB150]